MRGLRIGVLAAGEIESGDILIHVPYETWGQDWRNARVLGTVLHVRSHGETRSWILRTPAGSVIEHPQVDEPVGRYVNTYVHVPRGRS